MAAHQKSDRVLPVRGALKEKSTLEQERSDFFSMMFHDLKNPITAAVGSIDIIREGRLGPVNSEQEEYLQSAIDSCNEIVTMIDNLLDMQRFEAGMMTFSIRPCNASDIAVSAVKQFTRAAEHDNITLTLDTADDVAEIAVDRSVMGRVLANLLVNAIKFTPDGGTIMVSCRCIEHSESHPIAIPDYVLNSDILRGQRCCLKFSVRDSGNGIPAEDLGRIFERYTQSGNATAREKGGAGLGLAFCKMAVESFHGVIWAESTLENGSEFSILLPCHTAGESGCSHLQRRTTS